MQVRKGSHQKQPRKCDDVVFPIISLWQFFPTLPITYKYEKDPIQNSRENVMT